MRLLFIFLEMLPFLAIGIIVHSLISRGDSFKRDDLEEITDMVREKSDPTPLDFVNLLWALVNRIESMDTGGVLHASLFKLKVPLSDLLERMGKIQDFRSIHQYRDSLCSCSLEHLPQAFRVWSSLPEKQRDEASPVFARSIEAVAREMVRINDELIKADISLLRISGNYLEEKFPTSGSRTDEEKLK